MILTCDCCGISANVTPDEAVEAGWDSPISRHVITKWVAKKIPEFAFITKFTVCNLCPISLLAIHGKEAHSQTHLHWSEHGRPKEFSIEECIPPGLMPKDEALLQRIQEIPYDELMRRLQRGLES